jgi:hypothetical protein
MSTPSQRARVCRIVGHYLSAPRKPSHGGTAAVASAQCCTQPLT